MISISLHGHHFADDICVYIFLGGNFIQISQNFVTEGKLYISIDSGNGLMLIRQQMITCTNVDKKFDAIWHH